jgi:hypothetical protein
MLYFIKYIFDNEKIAVKIPFLKINECNLEDIIGYAIFNINGNNAFLVYTKNKHIAIRYGRKKIKQEIIDFINRTCDIIKKRNLEELKHNGIKVKINRYKDFYTDYLEMVIKGNNKKYHYKELTVKLLNTSFIKLVSKEDNKIDFNIYQSKGNIGLFDYLINYEWEYKSPNGI